MNKNGKYISSSLVKSWRIFCVWEYGVELCFFWIQSYRKGLLETRSFDKWCKWCIIKINTNIGKENKNSIDALILDFQEYDTKWNKMHFPPDRSNFPNFKEEKVRIIIKAMFRIQVYGLLEKIILNDQCWFPFSLLI